MIDSIKKFSTETPATKIIGIAILAVFGVMLLISGGVFFWQTYLDIYTSMGGGFFALCVATSAASIFTLVVGLGIFCMVIFAFYVIMSVLDGLGII